MKIVATLRKIATNRLLLVCVVLPTALSAIYFGLVASDIYISESKFVIRTPERQTSGPIGLILQGAGFARAQDDSFSVQEYVQSRDALKQVDAVIDLKKLYTDPNIDIFNRFGALDGNLSTENLYKYFRKQVYIQLDSTTSVSTLSVRSFTPGDAARLNMELLKISEELINRINTRARQDLITAAKQEVEDASKNAKDASIALQRFRTSRSVLDPERQASFQLQQITKLQDELLASKLQLNQLRIQTPDNSQIKSLQGRISLLEREIELESSRITGGDRSLANKAAEYQRLALDRELRDKQLISALSSFESATNESRRKHAYLERIVNPNTPDYPLEPRRIRNVFATFVLGLVMWGILGLFSAGIREHTA